MPNIVEVRPGVNKLELKALGSRQQFPGPFSAEFNTAKRLKENPNRRSCPNLGAFRVPTLVGFFLA
jgi:hypothetical protein